MRSALASALSLPSILLLLAACNPPDAAGPANPATAPGPGSGETGDDPAASAAPPVVALDETPPTFRLPDGVRPIRYDMDFTLIPEQPDFHGVVAVDIELDHTTRIIWLNSRDLEVQRAEIAAASAGNDSTSVGPDTRTAARIVDGGKDFVGFALPTAQGPGRIRLQVWYKGTFQDEKTIGFYRVQEQNGDWHAYSMFEPLDARRAFPCFDEPAFKVPWKLTIRVPAGQVALANSPIESSAVDPETGLQVVRFQETKPLPSYLVALVVGPFEIIDGGTAGRDNVRLRYIIPRGREDELWYAKQTTARVVSLLEDYFDIPYPFEKLDVAVVARFWGTMEHPGLVAMGQPLTLIKPDENTIWRRQHYVNILIHELGHYWFGDLVTHAWWDDIWLNEGLGTWIDRKITDRFEPAWEYDMERMWDREGAMSTDALLSAKRIREPATSNDDIAHSFDNTITYSKGGQVIGMFENWIGEERFRAGIQHYLQRYAWKNARSEDFIATMSEKVGAEFGPAIRTFLDQPGYPLVTATLSCAATTKRATGKSPGPAVARPQVELTQRRYVTAGTTDAPDQTWSFPVCMRYGDNKRSYRQCVLMSEQTATVELDQSQRCPRWLVANDGGYGYYRVQYPQDQLSELLGRSARKLTLEERVALFSDLVALAGAGEVTLDNLLGYIPSLVKDGNPHLLFRSLAILGSAGRMMPRSLEDNFARYVRKVYGKRARALGWKKRPGDAPKEIEMRPLLLQLVAIAGKDKKLQDRARKMAREFLRDPKAIEPEMVGTVLTIAAHRGDRALFDAFLAAAREATDHSRRSLFLGMLGDFSDPALARRALALVASDEFDMRDTRSIVWSILGSRDTRELGWAFIEKHYDDFLTRWSDLTASYSFYLPQMFCEQDGLDRAEKFLGSRLDKVEGAAPIYRNALEKARACIAIRRIQEPAIAKFLRRQ